MKTNKNRLSADIDWGMNSVFIVPILVVFFGVVITAQMAAIKLAGGFFYSREVDTQNVLKNSRSIEIPAISRLSPLSEFSMSGSDGRIVSGADILEFLPADIFVLPFAAAALFLARRGETVAEFIYESDCIRIRPPIV